VKQTVRNLLITAAAAASIAASFAFAQGIVSLTSPVGTELVTVAPIQSNGQPGAIPAQVTINQLRNTTGYLLSAQTSGTLATTVAVDNLLLTGAVGTLTVDVPPSPSDGQLFSINNASGSNFSGTITVASTDSSTFVPSSPTISNLAANSSQEWQYTAASKVWYRIR